jgi:hypothetical protein
LHAAHFIRNNISGLKLALIDRPRSRARPYLLPDAIFPERIGELRVVSKLRMLGENDLKLFIVFAQSNKHVLHASFINFWKKPLLRQ